MFKSSQHITRRTLLLVATVLIAVFVAGGIALAETFTCTTNPCNGTEGADVITGTEPDPMANLSGNDTINGLGGDDWISALGGSDSVTGGQGNDTMDGGMGRDSYFFADSFGADRIEADSFGVDTVDFSGTTTAPGTGFIDGMVFDLEGPDLPCDSSAATCLSLGGSFVENVVGTDFGDKLTGNASRNKIIGGAGDDWLNGGDGPDQLLGNNGTDRMNGGAGNDKLNGSPATEPEDANNFYDYYYVNPSWGKDTITDTRARGVIMADAATAASMPNLTVKLTSDPTRPEVKDGNGNTINWANNDVKGVVTGAGDDVISQRPKVSNLMNGGAGSDTYKGYTTDPSGEDSIYDPNGAADVLDLSNYDVPPKDSWRIWKNTSTGNVETVHLWIGGAPAWCIEEFCRDVFLNRYFDNTSPNVCASGPGPGLIETIKFRDDESVDFEQIKSLLGCP